MPIDLDDPKMVGYIPIDEFQLSDISEPSARIRDNSDHAPITEASFARLMGLYLKRGAGTPEGAVIAPIGTLYLRTDGGANTTLYVKQSGTGNTGWVAK